MKQPKNPLAARGTVPAPAAKKTRHVAPVKKGAQVHRPATQPSGPPLPKAKFNQGGNFAAFGK